MNETDVNLPVNVNLLLTVSLNGQEVYGAGSAGVSRTPLLPVTYLTDNEAMPGEVYRIDNELRLRSDDGQVSVTLGNV